jgi:glutamyl/glutaminyl-tRNA synthetase
MKLESVDKAITIQSSNVHLGDGLPTYARENLLRVASKYFGRLNTAAVHLTKEGIAYRCSVSPSSFGGPSASLARTSPSAWMMWSCAKARARRP